MMMAGENKGANFSPHFFLPWDDLRCSYYPNHYFEILMHFCRVKFHPKLGNESFSYVYGLIILELENDVN